MRSNAEWLAALRGQGEQQAAAVKDLRALLFRAIRKHLGSGRPGDAATLDARAED